ncbi:TonB-dependent receptor plug domain-containing protein [Flavobacterium sp. Sd200]|uniref:TonB-dependent receptor plug domain-containing protein n=1 Tax=Flavobacterium sp. Sd200 TaxID=2692211 RepID=UPI00137187D0|nr:TonB-dependent receptor plug domain-containing protein [Flavobacterium sp. Sd200]MXN91844.1 TonB-dependent receptor plug domain-containing protein [Flavobacterium sp. Sd200]
MKTINKLITLLILLLSCTAFAQRLPFIYGVALDEKRQPLEGVSVYYDSSKGRKETTSDKNGVYALEVPVMEEVTVWFSHISFQGLYVNLRDMAPGESLEFNFAFTPGVINMPEVVIDNKGRKNVEGIVVVQPEIIRAMVGPNAGVENILKSFAGVNSNNELSTGYNVRGGNFDENLVYVNDIEIYRPFLIRSGQQEGLSFTNTAMVENVDFSAGGFQAKYGDKMSSVLDITYRTPKEFGAALEASFLGGSLTVESASKDKRWSGIVGARYRDNSLLVNSQETETNFKPTFADIQALINFNPNKKWELSFLGNVSQNKYHYQPLTRQTNFGTIDNPIALQIIYDGQEKDEYQTFFGAFTSKYIVSDTFSLKFIGSVYHTQEQEYFDILAQYALGDVDTNIGSETFGDIQFARAVGSQLNHARNNLDALIANAEVKGYHKLGKSQVEWGAKYTREDIRDRLVEWEVIDSAGFSIRPPVVDIRNDQPYNPFTGELVPYQNVRQTNFVTINRLSGYVQWSHRTNWGNSEVYLNAGARAHQWQVDTRAGNGKSQVTVSPRVQFAIKPKWEMDMLFRLSGGMYHQPPFYRELRDSVGMVRSNVKAQQSIHIVAGNDYSFKLWDRPFKLISEAYYKKMDNVNTYTLENVRIRYRANNDATAYAYGLDLRMNGEFVPGTESWVSIGYMKTEENLNDRGYIARPTDQRLKAAILFQDYVPNIPNLKMYLNLVYNTGLPGGSPSYANPYAYQSRLNDYRRADAGFSYVFVNRADAKIAVPKAKWLQPFKELSLGLEIFNLFDNQNSITNTWVRDVYTKSQYGIPNYLTSRVFSLKLMARI